MNKEVELKLVSYDRDCRECGGDGIVEHVGEDITENCEHCNGTGRKSKLTTVDIFKRNITLINLSHE